VGNANHSSQSQKKYRIAVHGANWAKDFNAGDILKVIMLLINMPDIDGKRILLIN
jgi:hypothetical protein